MAETNIRMQLKFELDLAVPQDALTLDQADLQQHLQQTLGNMVINGLPSISAKQLKKQGIALTAHRFGLNVSKLTDSLVPAEDIHRAAPHLNDQEVAILAANLAAHLPVEKEAAAKLLRQKALAMVNEYRLVPCTIQAADILGQPIQLDAQLNITNGHIITNPANKQIKLKSLAEGILIRVDGLGEALLAIHAGHTLGGPVLDIPMEKLGNYRSALIALWKNKPH